MSGPSTRDIDVAWTHVTARARTPDGITVLVSLTLEEAEDLARRASDLRARVASVRPRAPAPVHVADWWLLKRRTMP